MTWQATWHPRVKSTPVKHRSTVVNGGQRRSTKTVNGASDGQRWRSTTVNSGGHRRTTGQPPPDHRSTVVDRQSTAGSGRVVGWVWLGQVGSWAGSGSGRPRVSCYGSRSDPLADVSSDVASHVALTWI
ncbi:hypothetical protein Tco_0402326 [Tanacetum coccineum]